jgi:CelD/BcsL family acetyltransferase involved in cellulose biosynthesis
MYQRENMKECTITVEPLEDLFHYMERNRDSLRWDCLFVLPHWLRAWWDLFGRGSQQYICVVKMKGEPMGIAPLLVVGRTARIIGDRDLCDYGDFIISPGRERPFFRMLFAHLRREGITRLEAGLVREFSPLRTVVHEESGAFSCETSSVAKEPVYRLKLPERWEGFLALLSRKHRHELRRKLRRLDDAGRYRVRFIEGGDELYEALNTFIHLFRMNQRKKAVFMDEQREAFFRVLASHMADAGFLRLVLLEIEGSPAASVMCFEYDSVLYLYNSGYDRRFARLSAGLLCKVFSIRDSIQRGIACFDFLKGDEVYKRQLGGTAEQLFDTRVILK